MQMMYRLALIIVFGLVIVLYAAARAEPPEQTFLVIDGVENVQTYQTDDGRRLQVDYSVDFEYPSLAIGKPQWEELKRHGWSRCVLERRKNQSWDNYSDISTRDERIVHNHFSWWVKDNRRITIITTYYSAPQESFSRCVKPDNSTQYVTILFDTLDYDHIGVMEEFLEVSCP